MRKKVMTIAGTSTAVALLILLSAAATATAGTQGPSNVGVNIGTWLGGIGKDLLIPIAGLFGLAAFFRRDVGAVVVVAVIACLVGIFVYDPTGAQGMITNIANTFTGGK